VFDTWGDDDYISEVKVMETKYWVFNATLGVVAGIMAGLGNLEVIILAGVVSFIIASILTKVLFVIYAGRIYTQDLFLPVILAVSVVSGIYSATIHEAQFSFFMAIICLFLCLLAEFSFLGIFGNERVPVVDNPS